MDRLGLAASYGESLIKWESSFGNALGRGVRVIFPPIGLETSINNLLTIDVDILLTINLRS
jgi:hypothetical protein